LENGTSSNDTSCNGVTPAANPSSGESDQSNETVSFAPMDLSDGRNAWEWKSRYPQEAKSEIWIDVIIVAAYLCMSLFLIFACLLDVHPFWVQVDKKTYDLVCTATCACVGGFFGGVVFSMKWLIHIIPKGMWNLDRRYWRLFSPFISGALALMMVLLVSSNILQIFNRDSITNPSSVLAFAALIGYFSDSASGKLAELAETLFGSSRKDKTTMGTPNDGKSG
jgi:hypothetical protein